MPGVPRGLGCDQCRAQKKKCTGSSTACARCSRLHLPCRGRGVQRFKFVDGASTGSSTSSSTSISTSISTRASTSRSRSHSSSGGGVLQHAPVPRRISNESTRLVSTFVGLIDWRAHISVNLPATFGLFLAGMPRRLGFHEGLDAACDSLVVTVQCYRQGLAPSTDVQTLSKYGFALKSLRSCLDDPRLAHEPETLGAIQVLMINQAFLAESSPVSHSTGVAKILRARGQFSPRNAFEAGIMAAQRGSVVVEALATDDIDLTDREWIDLVESELYHPSLDGRTIGVMAKLPRLLQRRRRSESTPATSVDVSSDLRVQLAALRDEMLPLVQQAHGQLEQHDLDLASHVEFAPDVLALSHCLRLRSYGFALATALLIHLSARGLAAPPEEGGPSTEVEYWIREILKVAHAAKRYRPLGSLYLTILLSVAYAATEAPDTRDGVLDLLAQCNLNQAGVLTHGYLACLERFKRRFQWR